MLHTVWGSCRGRGGLMQGGKQVFICTCVWLWGWDKRRITRIKGGELWRQLEAHSHLYNVFFSPKGFSIKPEYGLFAFLWGLIHCLYPCCVMFPCARLGYDCAVSQAWGRICWHKNNLPSWFCKFFCIISAHCSHSVAAAVLWYWTFLVSHVSESLFITI